MNATHTKARLIVAWIFGIYAAIVVLCNMPFMQHKFAEWTAEALEEQLKTKVEIGSVNFGFLNNIIVNDLYVEDQSHKEMLKVARVSTSINLFKLIGSGKIEISTAQLFGTKASIYKKTPQDNYNFQFVIDAFKSDNKESKPINLQINSLIVRHADISYNILSEKRKDTFDVNHLKIDNAGFNLSLKTFTSDSVNVALKRLSAKELNSGLEIKELALRLVGNRSDATLSDFTLSLPKTRLDIDSLSVHYPNYSKDKTFAFDKTNISSSICPADFSFLTSKVSGIDDVFDLSTTISGSDNSLDISKLSLVNSSKTITAILSAKATDYTTSHSTINADVKELKIGEGEIERIVSRLIGDSENLKPLYNLGNIKYNGKIAKDATKISSNGEITTDAGKLTYTADISNDKLLDAKIETENIDVKRILEDDNFGILNMNADATVDLAYNNKIPVGKVNATINDFDYNGYKYTNINVEAINNATDIILKANSEDENIDFVLKGTISNIEKATKKVIASLDVKNINPHALNLDNKLLTDKYSFTLDANANYSDINNIIGSASLNDIKLTTANDVFNVNNIDLNARLDGSREQSIELHSDFIDANINGAFKLEDLVSNFQNIVSHHLPTLVQKKQVASNSDINYNVTFRDAEILHHFIKQDYSAEEPVQITGNLNSRDYSMNLVCNALKITIGDDEMKNLNINCSSSAGKMLVTVNGENQSGGAVSGGKIIAIAHNNKVDTDIQFHNTAKDKVNLDMFATTFFTNEGGNLKTSVKIEESKVKINNDDWTISPSRISYSDKIVECSNFKLSNGNQYLEIDGKASPNPNDSLVVKMKDLEVAYILDLVNFHSVNFGGKASGRAIVNNIFGSPDANAGLFVKDFSLAGGVMGDANILAHWDKEKDGIQVNAHIVDSYMSQVGLSGLKMKINGVTDVNGYILPKKNELNLNVLANNTRADFLNGFIGSIFKDIDGRLNGKIDVVGPFSDINLIGDVAADMSFKLKATKVPYCISGDTIRLGFHKFDFEDIVLHDKQNNVGVLNGKMTHRNLANFTYDFNMDMTNLCAYNETEFNADKYLAQVWANGDIHITGSDGHPMTIDANVSPCKGSVFAYDSATPDALISNSFIDFHDITGSTGNSGISGKSGTSGNTGTSGTAEPDVPKEEYTYLGDLYMNVNIDLNPNCEVKLRMDNSKDGYISTFGNGTLQAKYYNKGSFQLFGNYNINSGKYRLYLQDLVYRNLDIQTGSKVEFNGNPFDANIHLICKHEINSVPLSDLTATKAYTSNNKVKVDCYLDITGHLNNMDLAFSFELPNVSEETRQLVKSMINSDEEMNKQMIYLLGFQRFYPTEMAQSNIDTYGTQAVNSLLSSTISGQINQMLSNMIGTSSKWNFGTGITTGENGWQDLDVEGMLSGRLFNDRLLINGNFGYRDNSLTNQANFIGDFEVKYRLWDSYDFFVKAYNQTNDRYFTKATLNTQGVGLSFQHDFEKYTLFNIFKKKSTQSNDSISQK